MWIIIYLRICIYYFTVEEYQALYRKISGYMKISYFENFVYPTTNIFIQWNSYH